MLAALKLYVSDEIHLNSFAMYRVKDCLINYQSHIPNRVINPIKKPIEVD